MFALGGILAALNYRQRTGLGQRIDTSLLEAGIALSVWEATEYFTTGKAPQPVGSSHRLSAPYQAFRCADGYMTVGAANDRTFARFCGLLGQGDWAAEPQFKTNASRVQHRAELAARIEAITVERPRSEWLARLDEAGIPCGPINDYSEVFRDEQVLARNMLVEIDHPALGPIRALGTPIKMSRTPLDPARRAPLLGEHNDEVLEKAGYSGAQIAELRRQGVFGLSSKS
jgi:formyl-CoA transferase